MAEHDSAAWRPHCVCVYPYFYGPWSSFYLLAVNGCRCSEGPDCFFSEQAHNCQTVCSGQRPCRRPSHLRRHPDGVQRHLRLSSERTSARSPSHPLCELPSGPSEFSPRRSHSGVGQLPRTLGQSPSPDPTSQRPRN